MKASEPVRRTIEIEEATNSYVIHPIAGRLIPLLASLDVSPNAVSLAGMVCGLSAGLAYYHYRDFGFTVAGFALMIAWHVFDGADGQLARLTHKQSQSGKILDGICDYITFGAVYVGLALAISQDNAGWVWGLVMLAGLCHALQAAAYEVQRQNYEFWGLGKSAAKVADVSDRATRGLPSSPMHRFGERLYRAYSKLQTVAGGDTRAQRLLAEVMVGALARTDADAVRSWYRRVFAPHVRQWFMMSANYRTLGIFIFSTIRLPVYYFLLEIVGFNLLLIILLFEQQKRYTMFFNGLNDFDRAVYSPEQAVAGRPTKS